MLCTLQDSLAFLGKLSFLRRKAIEYEHDTMQCDDEQKYSAFSLFSCAYSWRILLSTTSMNVYVMGCSQCPALAAKYSSNLTSQPGLKVNNVTVQALCMRHAVHSNQHIHPAGGCPGHLQPPVTRQHGSVARQRRCSQTAPVMWSPARHCHTFHRLYCPHQSNAQ